MKNLVFLAVILCSTVSFGASQEIVCSNNDSKLVLEVSDFNKGLKVDQNKSKLEAELSSLEKMNTLSVRKSSQDWTVVTLEGNNVDDTDMIAVLVMDSRHASIRFSVQVLVDGLEGGTYSAAFECRNE